MVIIDEQTGRPVQPVPVAQQTGLSLGQAVGLVLLGIGTAALASDLIDGIGKLLNPPPRTNRRTKARYDLLDDAPLSDFEWIFWRADGRCFYCGKTLCISNRGYYGGRGTHEYDHYIPISRGGADQPYNLVAACVDCNRAKSDMYPWEFDPERFRRGDRNPENYL